MTESTAYFYRDHFVVIKPIDNILGHAATAGVASRRVVLPKGLFRQTMFVWIKDGSIVCYHATSGRKIRMFLFVWRDYLTDLMDDHVLCQCHFFCTADSESSPSIQISRLRAASRVSERADFKASCRKPRLGTCKASCRKPRLRTC